MLAMRRAVAALPVAPDEAWVDGNRCPELPCPTRAIVKGDRDVAVISAASILAKTARDATCWLFWIGGTPRTASRGTRVTARPTIWQRSRDTDHALRIDGASSRYANPRSISDVGRGRPSVAPML